MSILASMGATSSTGVGTIRRGTGRALTALSLMLTVAGALGAEIDDVPRDLLAEGRRPRLLLTAERPAQLGRLRQTTHGQAWAVVRLWLLTAVLRLRRYMASTRMAVSDIPIVGATVHR